MTLKSCYTGNATKTKVVRFCSLFSTKADIPLLSGFFSSVLPVLLWGNGNGRLTPAGFLLCPVCKPVTCSPTRFAAGFTEGVSHMRTISPVRSEHALSPEYKLFAEAGYRSACLYLSAPHLTMRMEVFRQKRFDALGYDLFNDYYGKLKVFTDAFNAHVANSQNGGGDNE